MNSDEKIVEEIKVKLDELNKNEKKELLKLCVEQKLDEEYKSLQKRKNEAIEEINKYYNKSEDQIKIEAEQDLKIIEQELAKVNEKVQKNSDIVYEKIRIVAEDYRIAKDIITSKKEEEKQLNQIDDKIKKLTEHLNMAKEFMEYSKKEDGQNIQDELNVQQKYIDNIEKQLLENYQLRILKEDNIKGYNKKLSEFSNKYKNVKENDEKNESIEPDEPVKKDEANKPDETEKPVKKEELDALNFDIPKFLTEFNRNKKTGILDKIKDFFKSIPEKIENLKQFFINLKNKIKKIPEKSTEEDEIEDKPEGNKTNKSESEKSEKKDYREELIERLNEKYPSALEKYGKKKRDDKEVETTEIIDDDKEDEDR